MDKVDHARREAIASVRCPDCKSVLDVPEGRLGRNIYCMICGTRLTARPLALERKMQQVEACTAGEAGRADRRVFPLVVLVDNVRSLWNVGSIFRSADAFGVARLVLCGITGCPPRPEISKTALGAEQGVAWEYQADACAALESLTATGYEPVALETSADAPAIDTAGWPRKVCLLIGNEVAGVSPQLLRQCRRQVRIPMLGLKDSLNVAVAFGVAAHHASRALAAHEQVRRRATAG